MRIWAREILVGYNWKFFLIFKNIIKLGYYFSKPLPFSIASNVIDSASSIIIDYDWRMYLKHKN